MSRPTARADRLEGEEDVDLLLVTNMVNLRYLTGFTGSNGMALVGPGVRRFVTDFRYVEQAAQRGAGLRPRAAPQGLRHRSSTGWPDDRCARLRGRARHRARSRRLRSVLPGRIELGGGRDRGGRRAVKEPGEVEKIAAAAALCDEVYEWLRGRAGRAHRARGRVRARARDAPARRGRAEASPSIVASGPTARSRTPRRATTRSSGDARDARHGRAARRLLLGLHAHVGDGRAPDELASIYELTLAAQVAALDAVRPGPEGREVDAVARDMIAAAGHGEHFGHGLGHGVGIEVHEARAWPARATTRSWRATS